MKGLASAIVVSVVLAACSSSHHSSASTATTTPSNPTTTNAEQETQHTTPSSAGYFQVAEVVGSRNIASSRCQTLPTTIDCVRLGQELGSTADLVKFGQPSRNSYGDWVVAIRMSQRLTNNMNGRLHQPLAFIVDGTVQEVVKLPEPIHAPEFAINVGREHAAAVTLMRQLQNLPLNA